ncbi:hypothetical protein [Cupriavidus necator]
MLTAHHPDLVAALERHVKALAGDIGERNVVRPPAAADFIFSSLLPPHQMGSADGYAPP